MFPAVQSGKRRVEDGHSQPISHRISLESTMTSVSPAGHSDNSGADVRGGTTPPGSSHIHFGLDGSTKRSILRQSQVDAWQDMSTGLPAEKGFPIQIGSELFRLSGASIMSDGQSLFRASAQEIHVWLRVLEHPLISPSFSRLNCVKMKIQQAG